MALETEDGKREHIAYVFTVFDMILCVYNNNNDNNSNNNNNDNNSNNNDDNKLFS